MPPLQQSHYTPRSLPYGKDSRVRWAVNPSGVAVLFVHGFGGGATDTWDEFADRLPERPESRGHDLLFYGYESLTKQSTINAALFRDFLHDVATDPFTRVMKPSLRVDRTLTPAFRYRRIVLVAHSLGAVVVREALIQAANDPAMRPWLPLVQLALFAPAHTGAKVIALAEEAIGAMKLRLGSLVAAGYRAYAQVLSDLEPRSTALDRLKLETTRLLDEGVDALKARVVVQGDQDRIVDTTVFCADPGPKVEPGKGHTEVCKPSARYTRPVDHLLPLLVP